MIDQEKIAIRLTEKKDLSKITSWLMDKEVLKGFPMINEREVQDSVRFWEMHIEKKASITATYEGEPVGCANLYVQSAEKLKHQCLFVIVVGTSFRGQGVGTKLLESLEKRAKEVFHIELLHLEVYENNPAIALYERVGFKKYGAHPKYLKDPDGTYYDKVMMQKRLG